MNDSFSASYAAAGVDVTAGYESVELIKSHVKEPKYRVLWVQSAASAVCLNFWVQVITKSCSRFGH